MRGFESLILCHEKALLSLDKRAFSNEVCLSAREVMLRIVKLLRSEVSADVSSTLHFTLYEVQHFTAALPQLHFA